MTFRLATAITAQPQRWKERQEGSGIGVLSAAHRDQGYSSLHISVCFLLTIVLLLLLLITAQYSVWLLAKGSMQGVWDSDRFRNTQVGSFAKGLGSCFFTPLVKLPTSGCALV